MAALSDSPVVPRGKPSEPPPSQAIATRTSQSSVPVESKPAEVSQELRIDWLCVRPDDGVSHLCDRDTAGVFNDGPRPERRVVSEGRYGSMSSRCPQVHGERVADPSICSLRCCPPQVRSISIPAIGCCSK
jgi:hypothetical protein